jgi:cytochrome P450
MITKYKSIKKPSELYGVLELYGPNILTSNFEVWEKHRRLVGPHFTLEKHLRKVHSASVKHAHTMFQIWEKEGLEVCAKESLSNYALDVIGSAAFGYEIHAQKNVKLSDYSKDEIPEGVTMTLAKCLKHILNSAVAYLLLGKTVLHSLPFKLTKDLINSAKDFEKYVAFLRRKKLSEVEENYDLLSLMVKNGGLTTQELKADTFIFFVGGHESVSACSKFIFT